MYFRTRFVVQATALSIALVAGAPFLGKLAPAAVPAAFAEEAESSVKAPDFTARDLAGETVALSKLLENGPVFVHFWSTWCPSCSREMAILDRLDRDYRSKGFRVLAIAQDGPKTVQKVKPLVRSRKYGMCVITDPNHDIGNAYNVRQYPTSFLVAKDGSIVHYVQGYVPGDEEKITELVRGLLGAAPAGDAKASDEKDGGTVGTGGGSAGAGGAAGGGR